jgi:8-amino-7-oxononanoate synthase
MQRIEEELNKLRQAGQLRKIPDITEKSDGKIVTGGVEFVNFASNDYLGLSTKSELREKFLTDNRSLMSAASARLLTGSSIEYKELESTVANIFNKEAALIFNTGYQANLGVISALIGKGDVVFSDKLNHASIIDGMRLSDGDFFRYKHFDYDSLEKLLQSKRGEYKRAIIVSESVFSMDGDIADINKLVELKNKYNCLLMIDEAHAFCCCGKTLAGLSSGKDVDIITATFGKAVGSFGAFCVSNGLIIEYLINKARSFIFSTSIPPVNIAWSNWLLTEQKDFVIKQKKKLEQLVKAVHASLKLRRINTPSSTHIIPVVIGDNEKTLELSEKLKAMGYYIPAIRPPTVPAGTSRLRISLTADCKLGDFEQVLENIISA